MPAPSSVLRILSEQTILNDLNCPDCEGHGERLIFDAETGHDYQTCDACQGSGYNLLGLLVHGALKPPEGGFGPQEIRAALKQMEKQSPSPTPQAGFRDEAEAIDQPVTQTIPALKRIS